MFRCNNCGAQFYEPAIVYDDENDEQYDSCPKCNSDNFVYQSERVNKYQPLGNRVKNPKMQLTKSQKLDNLTKQPFCQTRVICSALSSDDWRRLAGHIDNGFFGSEKTFSAERKNGYYYLNTNKCDDVSMVRVFCQIGVAGIDKIERLGEDTDSWQEIHPNTYKSVEKFLNDMQS